MNIFNPYNYLNEVREYGNNGSEIMQSAATIAFEVVSTGQSKNWAGTSELDIREVSYILKPFNIAYINDKHDMHGTWKRTR